MRRFSLLVFLCAMHMGGVTLANTKPVADAGTKQKVMPGASVLLDGSNSFDPDGDPLSYYWAQLSGTPIGLGVENSPQLNFNAPDVGAREKLVFRLTVFDNKGKQSRDRVAVVVDPRGSRPKANAGEDVTVISGAIVSLDGSASTDPDNNIDRYVWKQVDGDSVVLQDADTVRAQFVAPEVNETTVLEFRVRVFDTLNRRRADRVMVTVEPNVGLELPGVPLDVTVTEGNAQLSINWSPPSSGGAVQRYDICFADSPIEDPSACTGGNLLSAQNSGVVIDDLINCSNYFVYVIAINNTGSSYAAVDGEPQIPGGLERIANSDVFQQSPDNRIHNIDLSNAGRYVVFDTYSSLVTEDTIPNSLDVYLRDRLSNSLTLVSSNSVVSGGSKPSITRDGRYIAFQTDAAFFGNDQNGESDIYVLDRNSGQMILASITADGFSGNGDSVEPSIVSHGDSFKLAFVSSASNLTNNPLSDNARRLHIRNHDLNSMQVVIIPFLNGTDQPSLAYDPKLSANGNHVLFNQANFLRFNTIATPNGPVQTAFYETYAYVYDEGVGATPVSGLQQPLAYYPRATVSGDISADGRFVTFASASSSLVEGDDNAEGDIFLVDRNVGTHTLISRTPLGVVGNEQSGPELVASISDDGQYIAYASIASDLVDNDDNNQWDTFVYDRSNERNFIVSLADDATQGNARSAWSVISPDGSVVAFNSFAENLVEGDVNGLVDVFIADSNASGCPLVQVAQ